MTIEIGDLPIKNGDFLVRYVNVYQAGYSDSLASYFTSFWWWLETIDCNFLLIPLLVDDWLAGLYPPKKCWSSPWEILFLTKQHFIQKAFHIYRGSLHPGGESLQESNGRLFWVWLWEGRRMGSCSVIKEKMPLKSMVMKNGEHGQTRGIPKWSSWIREFERLRRARRIWSVAHSCTRLNREISEEVFWWVVWCGPRSSPTSVDTSFFPLA